MRISLNRIARRILRHVLLPSFNTLKLLAKRSAACVLSVFLAVSNVTAIAMVTGGSVLLVSACSAEPRDTEKNEHVVEESQARNSGLDEKGEGAESKPSAHTDTRQDAQAATSTATEETASTSTTGSNLSTATASAVNVSTATATDANGQDSKAMSKLPNKELITTAKIDAEVSEKVLSAAMADILVSPDSIAFFGLEPNKKPGGECTFNEYPVIEKKQVNLANKKAQIEELRGLIFSAKSYIFDVQKRCRFRPDRGLRFIKGQEKLDIVFSFSCELWRFVHADKNSLENFDPVAPQLKRLLNDMVF